MTSRCVHRLRHACGCAEAAAVVRCTEKRSALHDLSRDMELRRARVKAHVALRAAGVAKRAAKMLERSMVLVPVRRQLPDVAGHLIQTVAVRTEGHDRRRGREAVGEQVLPW